MDAAQLHAAISEATQRAEELPGVSMMPRRRLVDVKHFNMNLKLHVDSIMDESLQRFYQGANAILLKAGELTQIWAEVVALDLDVMPAYKATLDEDTLLRQETVRASNKHAFDDACATTGDAAHHLMVANYSDSLLMDESFKLELAMSKAVAADPSGACLKIAVLKCLRKEPDRDIAAAVQELSTLSGSQLYLFSARSFQGKVDDILQITSHIMDENPPKIKADMSQCPFLSDLLDAVKEFCTVEDTINPEGVRTLSGTVALTYLVDSLTDCNDDLDPKAVLTLNLYGYLIPDCHCDKAIALAKKANMFA